MLRTALLVLLTLLTFQVSGVAAGLGDGQCDDDSGCLGDASGGQCAPNCHSCSCCSLPTVVGGTAVATLHAPDSEDASWIRADGRLALPDPQDILHVPKPLLA